MGDFDIFMENDTLDYSDLIERNDTDLHCALASQIVRPLRYRLTLMANCLTGLAAIAPNLLLLSIICRIGVFPPNLRLLLFHFSILLLWYGIGELLKSLYLLTVPICQFQISMRDCKLLGLFTSTLILPNMFYTLMALCTERLYATIRYMKYDKGAAKTPWLSCLLIIVSWTISIGIHGSPAFTLPSDKFVPICESTFVRVKSANIYVIYIIIELLAGVVSTVIFFYTKYVSNNMAINRAWYDLSSRFQVDQNLRINAILIPSIVLHMICHLPTFIFVILIRGVMVVPADLKSWLTRISNLWRLLYAVGHPILALSLNEHLRKELQTSKIGQLFIRIRHWGAENKVYRISTNVVASNQNMEEIHHEYIRKQWENGKKEKDKVQTKMGKIKMTALNCTPSHQPQTRSKIRVSPA